MPPSIATAEYLTLSEAAKKIPGRPHMNTVRRWCDRGHHGINLQNWRVGAKRVTSIGAIDQFITDSTARATTAAPEAPSSAHQIAEEKLDALGVK